MAGERLGRFELVSHLASGGMAKVFLARVAGLAGFERHVVLKTLAAHDIPDESYIGMFLDEARLAASLHHQHVAQVYEVGCTDETYFLAMEYVHGKTVRSVLEAADERRHALPLEFSLSVIAAAAAGLHHAHERCDSAGAPLNIVHRDVSPSNVLVSYDGSTKLIDFGIAKANARVTHTKTGFIKGKAGYMAPEQARGYEVDRRADVFALGIVAYELVTQHRAFDAPSEFERIEKIVHGEIAPPSSYVTSISPELDAAIMTALAVDPDDRYDTADDMRVAIEAAARSERIVLGSAPVARLLAKLFGRPREPWLPPPDRMARGSGQHDSLVTALPEPTDDADTDDITLPMDRDLMDDAPARPLSTVHDERSAASTVELRARAGTIRPTVPPFPRSGTASPPVVVDMSSAMFDVPGAMISDEGIALPRTRTPSVPPPIPAAAIPAGLPRIVRRERREPITSATPVIIERRDTPRPQRIPTGRTPLPARAILPPLVVAPRATPLRKQIAYVVVGGLVLGLAVGAIASVAKSKPVPRVAPVVALAPVAAPVAVPVPVAAPAPVAPVAPVLPVAPVVDEVTLLVTSEPRGATVVLDGERLGKTPFEMKLPRAAKESWLKVRMQKFNSTKIRVSRERDITWSIKLQPAS